MSRILFSAVLAVAFVGASVESRADENAPVSHPRVHHHYSHAGHHIRTYVDGRGYAYSPLGGTFFGWSLRPYPFARAAGYNYPGFYNNQSLWERVETQANYPVQY